LTELPGNFFLQTMLCTHKKHLNLEEHTCHSYCTNHIQWLWLFFLHKNKIIIKNTLTKKSASLPEQTLPGGESGPERSW